MKNDTVVIGVGCSGCKILSKLDFDVEKVFIDTDKEVKTKYSGLRIGEKTCGEYSSCGDTDLGEKSALENKKEILEQLSRDKTWVIIAPLGGGTTCGVTKKLVEFYSEFERSALVFTSFPFEFEGERRQEMAKKTLFYIENLCDVIELNIDKENIKNGASLNELFNQLDSVYLEELTKMLSE